MKLMIIAKEEGTNRCLHMDKVGKTGREVIQANTRQSHGQQI